MGEKEWIMLDVLHEEMNLTRAAKRLYTSQPSLSYRIKQLEEAMDVEILHRGNKGISFTPEGEHLVDFSREMIIKYRGLKDHLHNMKTGLHGTLRLGSSSNYAHYELPDKLSTFMTENKNVEVSLVTGWSTNILEKLQDESIHVAFIRGDLKSTGEKILLSKEALMVISTQKIELDALPSQNYIQYHTDPYLKSTIDKWWLETFESPMNITMEVDRIDTSIEMVKRGLGITIVPSMSIRDSSLFTTPLMRDGEKICRNTWVYYKKESLELNTVRTFIEMMKKE